jgi:LPXTG-site transpeptidase (sortase) family protein
VNFDVSNVQPDGITNYQQVRFTDQSGLVSWTIQNPNSLNVVESLPAGYDDPIVFCGDTAGLLPVAAPGGSLSLAMQAGQQLYCDWFNVQPAVVENPDIQIPVNGATLAIDKYVCPAGFDAYTADYGALSTNCSENMADVEFMVMQGDVILQSGLTDTYGFLDLGTVPAGSLSVVEDVPEGYGLPVVYCQSINVEFPQGVIAEMVIDGNQFSYQFSDGEEIGCNWFNVPGTEPADDEDGDSVTVMKLVCPEEVGDAPQSNITNPALQGVFDLGPQAGDAPTEVPDLCTEFEAVIGEGFTFNVSADDQDLGDKVTDAQGMAQWTGVPSGDLTISEQIPDGYGVPYFYCHTGGDVPIVAEFTGAAAFRDPGGDVLCVVVNVPEHEGNDGDVVVYKWECNEDPVPYNEVFPNLEAEGCVPIDGVDFALAYGIDSSLPKTTGSGGPGVVNWDDVPPGPISITETIPEGYGDPVVYCVREFVDQSEPLQFVSVDATGGSVLTGLEDNETLRCHWINIPYEDVSITLYKYTCPEGYDLYADGANPEVDCNELTDGIEFELRENGNLIDVEVTGSAGPGQIHWSPVSDGYYDIVERIPENTAEAFVLKCTGSEEEWIQNWPLSVGDTLSLELGKETHLVCYWYNVPEPDWGTVTVVKYACATEQFISPDHCEIYESGVQFELFHWTGAEGYVAGEGTTNASGLLTWTDLPDGSYELIEVDHEWCYAESSRSDQSGNIEVVSGEETTVWVYNCGVKTPLKQPVKYPNTGAGGAVVAADVSAAPIERQGSFKALPHNRLSGVLDSRIASSMALGGTPVRIRIDSIGLSAEIEVLEIVDGEFEDPTTSDKVAWYKDTSSLSQPGNVMMAGHLNYWGDPEGVFYSLADLQEGEIIEITAQDGSVHRYEVMSVSQVEATAETLETVAAQTEEPTLTLITCGGQWDPGIQSYLHRTVVKAIQID